MFPALLGYGGFCLLNEDLGVKVRIPYFERPHSRVFAHVLPIAGDRRAHSIFTMPFARADLPALEHDAGGQPFHIPFERCVQGLVKVVDVEDEPPFRRTETAKTPDMTIAARLDAG